MQDLTDQASATRHCRTGSSEKQDPGADGGGQRHCLTGSSETSSAACAKKRCASLPHRQLRNCTSKRSHRSKPVTAAQAAQKCEAATGLFWLIDTAAQAAQKNPALFGSAHGFVTAAQAAQKRCASVKRCCRYVTAAQAAQKRRGVRLRCRPDVTAAQADQIRRGVGSSKNRLNGPDPSSAPHPPRPAAAP